ncbi:MAG: undecaprenyl/decaprenyl-phosphate alpha-N-acetylglucosaminyl 1-phosphate transferase [Microthrixaceae bacterium]|jgi:UDP-GlcNAc:undecaprenyl-phosphate GlcNAc-1-phosphate transferase|nr:undecaprenyl/decaprenyl-phosphate alpha-N-acetylglucosaminyl 1-phosphate transferase [Microthrixaceae bacterium]
MPATSAYVVVFAVALLATLVVTPLCRAVAIRLSVVAVPTEWAVHSRPIPYLGGVAMLVGFLAALGVAWASGQFGPVFDGLTVPMGVAAGAVVLCAVGTLDDVRDVSAPAKTAGVVLAGSIMYALGVSLLYFRIPFVDSLFVLGPDLAPLVSVLWVLGMANAVNLIDGLDGLAAGIVAIAAGSFFLYGHKLATVGVEVIGPENPSPLISVAIAGVCLGFLPWNFNPARIFMGDGGALMLGGLMAASTMLVGGQTSQTFSGQVYFFFAPLFIPFFVMGVPIVDTAFAIVRRARRRAGVAQKDKEHLHHRLMRLGHGHRRSVVILWLWTGLLAIFVLYPVYTGEGDSLVPMLVLLLCLVLYTFFHPGVRAAKEDGESDQVGDVGGESLESDPDELSSTST